MIDRFVHSMVDAMTGIADGSTVLLGGFGDVGIPTPLLDGLIEQGARDLSIVAVAGGRDGSAIERLLSLGRVRRLICSFVRPASLAGRLFQRGELEVDIVPQGTLAERMRAAGAGITGFYTPTGADTLLAEGRETREIGGRLLSAGIPPARRCRIDRGVVRGPLGQPDLSRQRAELEPGDGDGGAADHRHDAQCRGTR